MWGSDMPNVERFCTYRQSLDYVRQYCPFLTAREKDLILGDTCAAFYGIGKSWFERGNVGWMMEYLQACG